MTRRREALALLRKLHTSVKVGATYAEMAKRTVESPATQERLRETSERNFKAAEAVQAQLLALFDEVEVTG